MAAVLTVWDGARKSRAVIPAVGVRAYPNDCGSGARTLSLLADPSYLSAAPITSPKLEQWPTPSASFHLSSTAARSSRGLAPAVSAGSVDSAAACGPCALQSADWPAAGG